MKVRLAYGSMVLFDLFYTHLHVVQMCVNNRSYAVTDPEGNVVSGRAEWDILFRNIWHNVPNVPEKDKNVPRCRRRNPPLSEATGPFERARRNSCQ